MQTRVHRWFSGLRVRLSVSAQVILTIMRWIPGAGSAVSMGPAWDSPSLPQPFPLLTHTLSKERGREKYADSQIVITCLICRFNVFTRPLKWSTCLNLEIVSIAMLVSLFLLCSVFTVSQHKNLRQVYFGEVFFISLKIRYFPFCFCFFLQRFWWYPYFFYFCLLSLSIILFLTFKVVLVC